MKESDRLQTLGQLEESRLKLLKALADMPLLVDTLALQRQKTALEVFASKLSLHMCMRARTCLLCAVAQSCVESPDSHLTRCVHVPSADAAQ